MSGAGGLMTAGHHGMILEGRYRLERVLGQGSSARTWLAVDVGLEAELLAADEEPDDLDQDGIPDAARVVVKELPLSRLREWRDLELFKREAQMLEALDHPGIPQSLGQLLLEDDSGSTFYLIQSWIDGQDLGQLLSAGERFTARRAQNLLTQVLPILHYLHTRKPALIHRDLKPSNIIVRRNGSVALIDFGAGRELTPHEQAPSSVVGTFGYMPPEQVQGRAVPASDLYALAATLCHLMCRRRPADMSASGEAYMIDFRAWCQIGDGFAALLDDMLAPALTDRLRSAREVMARLDALDVAEGWTRASDVESAPQAHALEAAGSPAPLTRPVNGPRALAGADYRYAYLGLPSRRGLFSILALVLLPLFPIGPLLALLGLIFFVRTLREGYHNARIMRLGTIISARVIDATPAGARCLVAYTYTFNRQRYKATAPVPRGLAHNLSQGAALAVSIDPYAPEDSVPLLGAAGRRLTAAPSDKAPGGNR